MKCDQHVVYQSLQFRAPARPHVSLVANTENCIHRPRHAGTYGLWLMGYGYGLWLMAYGLWYSTLATRSELPEDPLLSSFISMSTRLAPLGRAACVICPPDHALGTHVCQYWDPSFSSLSSVEPLLGNSNSAHSKVRHARWALELVTARRVVYDASPPFATRRNVLDVSGEVQYDGTFPLHQRRLSRFRFPQLEGLFRIVGRRASCL